MTKLSINGRTIYVSEYRVRTNAISAASRSAKSWIVLGDADEDSVKYWVCRPVDAARLENAGYEIMVIW